MDAAFVCTATQAASLTTVIGLKASFASRPRFSSRFVVSNLPYQFNSGLNNILICYHGCVPQSQTPLTYRQHPNDIQAHVDYLLGLGYTFVLPEFYSKWQSGEWFPEYPIACIHLDDGLESINLILPWLVDHKVPFGLAIIGRRQKIRLPETDFLSWAQLKGYVDSGYCELMSHTYNLHHLTIGDVAGNSQPVMQGPWFVDNGMVVYREDGDQRHMWDWSFIDGVSWGLPLFGTDPSTLTVDGLTTSGSTPITTSITLKATKNFTASLIRFWTALGVPGGAGYDVEIQIKINATLVFDGIFPVTKYSTRSQWVEREMATITFDTPYAMTLGNSYTITFETQNVGPGLLRIYTIPDIYGSYTATSTCISVKPGVSSGSGIIDYPAGSTWPTRPVIILGDGTGALVDQNTYLEAMYQDLTKNNQVIADYLNAVWTEHIGNYRENFESLFVGVAFGTYSSGRLVNSVFQYDVTQSHTATTLAFKFVIEVGTYYPILADCYIGVTNAGPWIKVATFAPNYSVRNWQEIALDLPYDFGVGTYFVRFQTQNVSPYAGPTLLRIYVDQIDAVTGCWFTEAEGSDITVGLTQVGRAFIKTLSVVKGSANTPKRIVYPFGAYSEGGSGPAKITSTSDVGEGLKGVLESLNMLDGQTTWPTANRIEGSLNEPGLRKTKWTQSRLLMYGDVPTTTQINNIAAYTGSLWKPVEHSGVKWQTSLEPDAGGNATVREAYASLDYVNFDSYYLNANASWAFVANQFVETNPTLYVGVMAGTYTDLTMVDSQFLYEVPVQHIAEKMSIKLASSLGAYYAMTVKCYVSDAHTGPWTLLATFTPTNTPLAWQEFSITPYQFFKGDYWIRFETTTASGAQSLLRFYMDHIDATIGAYYLKTEGSDTWTGLTANANAFIKTRSLQAVGIYPGRLSDGGTYITFDSVTGTLSGAITGPTGSGTIVWYNGNPNNRIAKISGYTGTFTEGETWTTSGGSGVVNVIETIPDEKTFLQSRGIKCFLYITNYNFDIGDFDGALSNVVVNYPSGYITSIVNTIVNDGWDGANIDIENVYQTDRIPATNFIVSVADALHAVRKLIHVPVPAITNTPYDNLDWTGWCDYTALLKRVDAIHIMTYLEAGDNSDPGPHAPQSFWNLVYNYIITTVPARLRCKILVGCNAYSHVWDDTGAGSYNSFWDALAQGLLRGALIETKESESTWTAHDYTAWMGVTDTHTRAVHEAIRRKFQGIGSWKMDDGNRLTYFPKYPQLGRSKL